ncbi:unnamed protein product, partial [Mesorhabditis spiculigera]
MRKLTLLFIVFGLYSSFASPAWDTVELPSLLAQVRLLSSLHLPTQPRAGRDGGDPYADGIFCGDIDDLLWYNIDEMRDDLLTIQNETTNVQNRTELALSLAKRLEARAGIKNLRAKTKIFACDGERLSTRFVRVGSCLEALNTTKVFEPCGYLVDKLNATSELENEM